MKKNIPALTRLLLPVKDYELFKKISSSVKFIFTVEEGVIEGGFGSAVSEAINSPITRIGLPREFILHGKRDVLLEKYDLTAQGIYNRILEVMKKNG